MYDIIKEKNLLKFVLDEKTYCLDLNTGNLLGLRGFPLKSTPRDLEDCLRENYDKNTISTALWYFYWCQDIPFHKMTTILSEIQMFDTLDSIGYRLNYDELSLPRIRFVQEHLKEFSKAFKEDSEINFVSFFQEYYVLLKCKEYNIVIDDHFTTAMARSLIDNANTFLPWQIKWVKYYMQKGLYTLLEDRLYIMYGKMQEYFRYCDYLHIEPIKTDFLRAYLEVKNTYLTNKTKYDDEALKQNQERYKKSLLF